MATGSTFRLARAAVFAAVCVVVTALGHALMSGVTLPLWSVACAFAGTTAVAWWAAGRERGALAVTGSTVIAQCGLHILFLLSATVGAAPAHGGMHHSMPMPAPMHHGADTVASVGSMHSMHSMGSAGPDWPWHGSGGMALAHLFATLISGVWLWRGETAAFRLGRALAAAVFVPLRIALRMLGAGTAEPPAWSSVPTAARRLRGALRWQVIRRRGPPGHPLPCH
ncbi:hypothetical protein [Streptomyces sp. NA02950]|uniref:hypothetical protein n=1 Tax=Streptomyces sp. NA02950 TaxID=2742137 RepID=UPI0020CB3C94|nr:hypothetical protein [Streptomyces sp. NA02950]